MPFPTRKQINISSFPCQESNPTLLLPVTTSRLPSSSQKLEMKTAIWISILHFQKQKACQWGQSILRVLKLDSLEKKNEAKQPRNFPGDFFPAEFPARGPRAIWGPICDSAKDEHSLGVPEHLLSTSSNTRLVYIKEKKKKKKRGKHSIA